LANDPKLILADEPTGNLDSKYGEEIMDILIKLNKEKGTTLLLITHDISVAKYAERIIRLKDGMIVRGE
jgi:putative ABC transport system ATP-binding protein